MKSLRPILQPDVRSIQKLLQALVLTLAILVFTTTPAQAQNLAIAVGANPSELLRNTLQWIQDLGVIGAIAFIFIYVGATVAFLPGSFLTLGAGVVFGVLPGSIYVLTGATLGAIAAFWVGRYLVRGWVAAKIAHNRKFAAIDKAINREGFKIVLLTRLSPVFPFVLLNYALGVTGVSFKDYALGCIGMIPGTIMYVYLGSLAGSITQIGTASQPSNSAIGWVIRIIGFLATVAITLYITRLARNALDQTVGEDSISENRSL
jgi:uncharacterized membrane protein YdjX (TVP38/TMEM64 family)